PPQQQREFLGDLAEHRERLLPYAKARHPLKRPPAPGSFEHAVLVGKLAFFTALGIPDNGFQGTGIRKIIPRNFKGKASKDAWSSCGSCHNDGYTDGVTWIFGTGPRQTIPLDGMFSKQNPEDQRLLNWSAV